MAGIFSKIVSGEIPCYKLAENDDFLAFLDVSPLNEGHTLVIPKKEIDYIFDIDDDLYVGLHLFAKKVAKGLKSTIPCKKIGVTVIGLEVPHAHIHLVPINSIYDMDFKRPKLELTSEKFQAIAESIKKEIAL